jgi:hypothetical protein
VVNINSNMVLTEMTEWPWIFIYLGMVVSVVALIISLIGVFYD